ncbi:hypothetical protein BDV38DRAFT_243376 [Aspergillus pseudotamarii]|uniref:Uncharacterized protein n=1 Tax=Aspergillus pseudotamarii TaxID=132259 RepID=A0A5N6T0F5_ASPPS|nr:uncharacterized protein BDV38DRAFT_243376 [Aspergillus pseudotamarii]KAE8138984.1 hypothetical protein BDV38DRAFT_243376 [Aspergillus pseudotamarii]
MGTPIYYPSRPYVSVTATDRVLSSPELLCEIFSWINKDDTFCCTVGNEAEDVFYESIDWSKVGSLSEIDWSNFPEAHNYGKRGVLLRCSLVNSLWWSEAIRFIWERLSGGPWNTDLPGCFAGFLDPYRKQFHANLVKQADLVTIDEDNADAHDRLIEGVIFSKLERLCLYCPENVDYVPQLQCPSLKILEIDPYFESEFGRNKYGLSQEQWDKVLDRISVLFPTLQTVNFLDYARVWPGALTRFEKRLPALEAFDKKSVVESTNTEIW